MSWGRINAYGFSPMMCRVEKDDTTRSAVGAECRWCASEWEEWNVFPTDYKIGVMELWEIQSCLPPKAACMVLRTWPQRQPMVLHFHLVLQSNHCYVILWFLSKNILWVISLKFLNTWSLKSVWHAFSVSVSRADCIHTRQEQSNPLCCVLPVSSPLFCYITRTTQSGLKIRLSE